MVQSREEAKSLKELLSYSGKKEKSDPLMDYLLNLRERMARIVVAYDKNGNLTDDGCALTLKWDALNRLREACRKSDGALIAKYTYDAGNRRMRKDVLS